eukprot:CAMPEP_0172719216 /NCGR_PEP_ID=MMETSP1074-20121228/75376_1 /TAXON_ID=2916 /ORGANISM="Ceratium fusus, Strain PA161109" /LENGTH=617 /DNA_ID=CAMNT_0013544547 /DNA_START=81 /DNA_END=1935 /DNA_ORIENTATION=+
MAMDSATEAVTPQFASLLLKNPRLLEAYAASYFATSAVSGSRALRVVRSCGAATDDDLRGCLAALAASGHTACSDATPSGSSGPSSHAMAFSAEEGKVGERPDAIHYDAFRTGVREALQRVAANQDQTHPPANAVDSEADWLMETPPRTMQQVWSQQSMPTPLATMQPSIAVEGAGPAALLLRNPGTARALAYSCFSRLKLNKAGCLPRSDLQLCLTSLCDNVGLALSDVADAFKELQLDVTWGEAERGISREDFHAFFCGVLNQAASHHAGAKTPVAQHSSSEMLLKVQEATGSSIAAHGGRPTVQVKVRALSGSATVVVPAGATQEELRVLVEEATGVDASRQVLLRRLGDGPLTDLRTGEVITLEVDGGIECDSSCGSMFPVGTSAASFARIASAADMCAGLAEDHAPPEVCPEAKSRSGSIDLAAWSPQSCAKSKTVLHWVGHTAVEGLPPEDALLGGGAFLADHLQCSAPAIDLATNPDSYMELLATGANSNSVSSFVVEWPDQSPGPDFFDASSAFTVELWVQLGAGTKTPGTLLGKCGPAAGWEIRQLQETLQFSVVLQTKGRSWRHTVEQKLCGGSFNEPPVHVAAILDGHRLDFLLMAMSLAHGSGQT